MGPRLPNPCSQGSSALGSWDAVFPKHHHSCHLHLLLLLVLTVHILIHVLPVSAGRGQRVRRQGQGSPAPAWGDMGSPHLTGEQTEAREVRLFIQHHRAVHRSEICSPICEQKRGNRVGSFHSSASTQSPDPGDQRFDSQCH